MFFKAPKWFWCGGRAENLWGQRNLSSPVPRPSGLCLSLSSLFMSLPVTWHNDGTRALRKIAWPWEATLQSEVKHDGAKHLYYATLKHRTLHSWNASIIRDRRAHLQPQLTLLLKRTFLKEVNELNNPWGSPFLKKMPCTHPSTWIRQPAYELMLPLPGMKHRSQTLGNKGLCIQC